MLVFAYSGFCGMTCLGWGVVSGVICHSVTDGHFQAGKTVRAI